MEKIYFALVDTPGFFASMIRKTIGISYVHVAIGLDPCLRWSYSIGRRHPSVPILAGFEQERLPAIHKAFPTARYKIVSLECEAWQKAAIAAKLEECYNSRYKYHYCILGLPFLLMNLPFYQKNHYTPRDFYELPQTKFVYEGSLAGFLEMNRKVHYGSSQWETLYES